MQDVILMPRSPRRVHWAAALEEETHSIIIDSDATHDGPLTACDRLSYFALVGCGVLLLLTILIVLVYAIFYATKAGRH